MAKKAVQKNKLTQRYIIIVFLVFALLEGMMFSVLTPAGKNPDEYTHFEAMTTALNMIEYNGVADVFYHDTGVYDITVTSSNKVDRDLYESLGNQPNTIGLPVSQLTFRVGVLKFIPQVIGFLIAAALHLPILPMLQLMEAVCLLFFILCGILTLRIMPFQKHIMLFCLLMPMTLHQCASINYDVQLISLSFLLIAYIFHLKADEEARLRWRSIIVLLVLTGLIAIVKPVYAPILLLALTIPLDKYELRIGKKIELGHILKKWPIRIIVTILVVVGLGAGVYLVRHNEFVNILLASMFQPRRTFVVLRATLQALHQVYLHMFVGSFGALDLYVEPWFITLFLVAMLVCILFYDKDNEQESAAVTIRTRLLMLLICAGITVLIFISMYAWSLFLAGRSYYLSLPRMQLAMYSINLMLGVQGRYFIPFTPLLMMAVSGILKQLRFKKLFYIAMTLYLLYAARYVTLIMLYKFWI